jgi:hydrogenase maturation protein HypF
VLARRGKPGARLGLAADGDWRGLVQAVWEGREHPEDMARAVHEALVDWAVELARATELEDVVLTGGCFQSRLLREGCTAALRAAGHRVWSAEAVPCHDGGIAVGQAWVATRGERS